MTSAHPATRPLNGGKSLQTTPTALIVAGVVVCFGLLSFYGYLVQSQVERGEALREGQRAGLYGVKAGGLASLARAPNAPKDPLLANAIPR